MAASDTEQFFGPYRLVARLGHGGMGETWRAVHEGKAGVTKTVVIKRILQKHSASPKFRESFIQEARLSAQLNHGNVAHVFDFGEINGEYYMVMEHVNGRPLSHVLQRAEENGLAALPPPLVAYVGIGVLQGLAHAHGLTDAKGQPLDIVHRDVSPDNVMLSYEGEVKLLDFGIARAQMVDREQTLPGTFKGKINFVSPEQARGQAVDARSDLWSAGLMLYRLLSGKQPGDDPDERKVLENLVRGEFPRTAEVAPWVPRSFTDAIDRALEVKREQRWQTAQEFAEALTLYLHRAAPSTSQATAMGVMAWLYRSDLEGEGRRVSISPAVSSLIRETKDQISGDDAQPARARTASAKGNRAVARAATAQTVDAAPSPLRSPQTRLFRKRSTLAFLLGCGVLGAAGVSVAAYFLRTAPLAAAPEPPPPPELVEADPPAPPAAAEVDPALDERRQQEAAEAAEIAAARAEIAAARAARDREVLEKIERDRQALKAGKPTRPVKPARIPKGFGALSLSTVNPTQAEVFLDKTGFGPTPIVGTQLPAGRHSLRVFDADWKARKLEVLIVEGKVNEQRGVDVTSLPYLDPPAPVKLEPKPQPAPAPPPVAAPPVVAAREPAPNRLVLRGVVSVGVFTIDVQNQTDQVLTRCRVWVRPNLTYAWPEAEKIGARTVERVSKVKFNETTQGPRGWDKNFSLLECAEGAGHMKTVEQ